MSDDLKVIAENTEAVNRLADEIARHNSLLIQHNHLLQVFNNIVIPAKDVTKRMGLNKNTLGNNDKIPKYQPRDKNVNLVIVSDLTVIENRKTKRAKKKSLREK